MYLDWKHFFTSHCFHRRWIECNLHTLYHSMHHSCIIDSFNIGFGEICELKICTLRIYVQPFCNECERLTHESSSTYSGCVKTHCNFTHFPIQCFSFRFSANTNEQWKLATITFEIDAMRQTANNNGLANWHFDAEFARIQNCILLTTNAKNKMKLSLCAVCSVQYALLSSTQLPN